ncbi:MAG: GH3 family acyl-acid amido synthetase [Bacillota bacterium]
MAALAELLKEGKMREAWLKYCGFIDLTMPEFMEVQERLLKEQLVFLGKSVLGKKLLGSSTPVSVDDFRKNIPLTTYKDYAQYFADKREDVLPAKPAHWVCTSGQVDGYDRKWAPYPKNMAETHIKNFLASIIFSLCTKKGEFTLRENYKFLYAMAPPPYLTGMVPYGLMDSFAFQYLPSLEAAEKMTFEERNKEGFRLGLIRGMDLFFGVSSILVRIGEKFVQRDQAGSSLKSNNPLALLRLTGGFVKSSLRRGELLPRDVWNLRGIVCAGTDTAFYKERIEYYWGKKPLEIYGGTEIGIAATQTWDHEGMTLFPDANYWEFIPEEECRKSKTNAFYQPKTILLDQLEADKRYELVITNFKGGAFVRYRVGDMIKVLSTRNLQLGVNLPQLVYEDRIDDVIDLAGFTRITERTLWEGLKRAGVTHGDWLARKTFFGSHPIIELYLEMPYWADSEQTKRIEDKIHLALQLVDPDYHDLQEIMVYRPLRLVPMDVGTLKSLRQKIGAAGDWGITRRINPPETILSKLPLTLKAGA